MYRYIYYDTLNNEIALMTKTIYLGFCYKYEPRFTFAQKAYKDIDFKKRYKYIGQV